MSRFVKLSATQSQPEHHSHNHISNSPQSTTHPSTGRNSLTLKVCRHKLVKTDIQSITIKSSATIRQLKELLKDYLNIDLALDNFYVVWYNQDTHSWSIVDESNLSVTIDQLRLPSGSILSVEYVSLRSTGASGSKSDLLKLKLCEEPRDRDKYTYLYLDFTANFSTLRREAYRKFNKRSTDRPIFLWIKDRWMKFDATNDNEMLLEHSLKDNTFISIDYEENTDTKHAYSLCGITNLGNTCYMNSVFQCLNNIPEFIGKLLVCGDEANSPIIGGYTKLVKNMRSGKWASVDPTTLVTSIEENLPNYATYRQQDAHEFMNHFLHLIHAELTTKDTLITDIFYGQLQSSVECLSCHQIEVRNESISFLPLPMSNYNQKSIPYIKANGEQHLERIHVDSSVKTVEDLINCFLTQHDLKMSKDRIQLVRLSNNSVVATCETWQHLYYMRDDELALYERPERSAFAKHIWCEFVDHSTGQVFRPPTVLVCPDNRCYYSHLAEQVEQLLGHLCSITGASVSDCHVYWSSGVGRKSPLRIEADESLPYLSLIAIEMDPQWIDIYRVYTHTNNSGDNSALIGLLNDFFREEPLDAKYQCSRCQKLTEARKKSSLGLPLPNVLIIQLKRFMYDLYSNDKIDTCISFPLSGLDLNPYIAQNTRDQDKTNLSTKYDLVAVSNHTGSLTSGHYTTYAKNEKDRNWYLFDDRLVRRVNSENDIVTRNAYILVYVKVT